MKDKDRTINTEKLSGTTQPLKLRTKAYALRIIKLYSSLPHSVEAQVIGKQLLRAGTAVGANTAKEHVRVAVLRC